MAVNTKKLQPGAILHEVIVGCLRSAGTSFDVWCRENSVNPSTARQATFGQSGGDAGKRLLSRLIEAAGQEQVEISYRSRIEKHANDLSAGVAA